MELAYYSDLAVRLVNSEEPIRGTDTLTSVEAVRALFGESRQAARRATDADVTRLRSVRARLRAVFEAAAGGDEVLAVDLLNALLIEFPVSPQISGHETRDDDGRPKWHMHIADYAANAGSGYAATASMGLAFHLTELGADRLGICEAAPCRNAYLDTSTNRSRRYCSDRCATRANVAAYRARKRLDAERSAGAERSRRQDREPTGRTADTAQETSPAMDR
ncbi:CGNR zinc finger domain-containing protein [Streptomyces antimycoticus]|uniref:CGNR zinc finger domain-containing protein n=3 Tax=Streptomyces TaxID=1883 RepID=A0ABD5JDW7_9ACTN|nr:CGNR zinc finger domain-containing protein [Streptomyces sp. WAC05858]AJZ86578.2 CGNR zinc finger domain-containing protein [Streptomyces sp. AgN23]KUL46662.1 zf-CGNR multi-domain protein [Streptomyces violaceusniger]MEE4586582.1 CGNR zinc finger domain-containing protein [Streptomyces sp. DSM 41602]RSS48382.1 zf-CGNR multi-domain protein [Streptomyces sp. WAC05858]